MRKSTLIFIISAFLGFVLLVLVGGIYLSKRYHLSNAEYVDKYGYVHNPTNTLSVSVSIDPNANRKYALVSLDKKYEDIFLSWYYEEDEGEVYNLTSYINAIIAGYEDKYYTTFVFSDNTGLMFSKDSGGAAIYGEIDDEGFITKSFQYIAIEGMRLSKLYIPGSEKVIEDGNEWNDINPDDVIDYFYHYYCDPDLE